MDNNDWKLKFLKRLKDFSLSIIFLCNKFPKTAAGFVIAQQLIKSSTSIGANVVEAQNASSRKDFIQKMSISLREANETVYWLELHLEAKLIDVSSIEKNIKESREIVAMLTSIVRSSKLK